MYEPEVCQTTINRQTLIEHGIAGMGLEEGDIYKVYTVYTKYIERNQHG
jgi:hypothetical protein